MRAVATSDVRAPLRIRRYVLALTALLTFAVVLALAPRADAYVYWADRGTDSIAGAYLDGAGVNRTFIPPRKQFVELEGVAVDATHIYWANRDANTIARAKRDGTEVNENFIGEVDQLLDPVGVAVDASYIYWTSTDNTVGRADLDGTGVNRNFITGASSPVGVDVDSTHIYWANNRGNSVGRADLDGTGVDHDFITGAIGPQGLLINPFDQAIYWANNRGNSIARASINGTRVNQNFIRNAGAGTGDRGVGGLAANANHIYWGNGPPTNRISRAKLDGTGVDRRFITGVQPAGMAVGAPDQRACTRAQTVKNAMVGRYRLATRVMSRAVTNLPGLLASYRRSSDSDVRSRIRNRAQRTISQYFMARRVAQNAAGRYFEQRRILSLC